MSYFKAVSKQLFFSSGIPLPPTQTKAATESREEKRQAGLLQLKTGKEERHPPEATPKGLHALQTAGKNFCPQQSPH